MRLRFPLLVSGLLLLAACQDRAVAPVSPVTDASLARSADPRGQPDRVRVIIRLQNLSDQAEVGRRAEEAGGRVLRRLQRVPLLVVEVNRNALEGLRRSPRVVSIEEDRPAAPTLDASLPVINADDVHALGWTGAGQTVVILDTGIDNGHPFTAGRVVAEACFSTAGDGEEPLCPNGLATETGSGAASNEVAACQDGGNNICDHGAHVAGIAAGDGTGLVGAPLAGVAPGAGIIAIQVFTRINSAASCAPRSAPCVLTYSSDQIAALEHVLALAGSHTIAAVNMSLGGGQLTSACDDDSRKLIIDLLLGANIATVIAAGNDGFDASVAQPGCISSAITVGATDNADAVTGFSNRGVLLDLFAPGNGITSSVEADGYGAKNGTSMATPHVTGAFALLRQADPSLSVADLLARLQDTGVDITYSSDGGTVTTPRIDLLAALAAGTQPPVITVANATVTVDEGTTATNSGTVTDPDGDPVTVTASRGFIELDGDTWSWSFSPFDGPAQSQTVTVIAADDKGAADTTTFALTVNNVAPTVTIASTQVKTAVEGATIAVSARFTDPGEVDAPFTASIVCWSVPGTGTHEVAGEVDYTGFSDGLARGTVTGQCPYGDRSTAGGLQTTVKVTDKDAGTGSASFQMVVSNVAPTALIDVSGATVINGVPTVIGQIGQPVAVAGGATDPGSDDLTLTWDWKDDETTVTSYLLTPPAPDALPSPNVSARIVSDPQSHTWATACLFDIALTALDDDGGTDSDAATVIMIGNSGRARSSGYWQPQYRNGRAGSFGQSTLLCYLAITRHMSAVFNEVRTVNTVSQAGSILQPKSNGGDMRLLLDQQLLAAWLNFANGGYGWTDLVDTNRDGVPDTAFSTAVMAAEAVRLNGGATRAQLEAQMLRLESINLMHGG